MYNIRLWEEGPSSEASRKKWGWNEEAQRLLRGRLGAAAAFGAAITPIDDDQPVRLSRNVIEGIETYEWHDEEVSWDPEEDRASGTRSPEADLRIAANATRTASGAAARRLDGLEKIVSA